MKLNSENITTVTDKLNFYKLGKFSYSINEEVLKGSNILINTDYNLPTSDKLYFKNAIINFRDIYNFLNQLFLFIWSTKLITIVTNLDEIFLPFS